MTRKHFEALADSIRVEVNHIKGNEAKEAVRSIAVNVAIVCKACNPGFDKSRFMAACGLEGK